MAVPRLLATTVTRRWSVTFLGPAGNASSVVGGRRNGEAGSGVQWEQC